LETLKKSRTVLISFSEGAVRPLPVGGDVDEEDSSSDNQRVLTTSEIPLPELRQYYEAKVFVQFRYAVDKIHNGIEDADYIARSLLKHLFDVKHLAQFGDDGIIQAMLLRHLLICHVGANPGDVQSLASRMHRMSFKIFDSVLLDLMKRRVRTNEDNRMWIPELLQDLVDEREELKVQSWRESFFKRSIRYAEACALVFDLPRLDSSDSEDSELGESESGDSDLGTAIWDAANRRMMTTVIIIQMKWRMGFLLDIFHGRGVQPGRIDFVFDVKASVGI
jgi:hypothetical protein